jgi:hypothetical protein
MAARASSADRRFLGAGIGFRRGMRTLRITSVD